LDRFCVGADLEQVKGMTDPATDQRLVALTGNRRARFIGHTSALFETWSKVTIVAANGYTLGGSWSLALG